MQLQRSWDNSDFVAAGQALEHYVGRRLTLKEVTQRIRKHVYGCGKYGAANLVRMLHVAIDEPLVMPGACFYDMSDSLASKYARLASVFAVGNVADFNALHHTFRFDAGDVAYLCCEPLSHLLE
jgi:hypothetical protein